MWCTDVTQGDSGNYTCQVEGPQNTILGQTTHFVYVRGLYLYTRHRHHHLQVYSAHIVHTSIPEVNKSMKSEVIARYTL